MDSKFNFLCSVTRLKITSTVLDGLDQHVSKLFKTMPLINLSKFSTKKIRVMPRTKPRAARPGGEYANH